MLASHPVVPVLLAPDLAASKDFYATKLGLAVVEEDDKQVTFDCGGGTRLRISASEEATKDSQTQLDWVVDDVRAEVGELRARGVRVEEYDTDEIRTVDGVADQGSAWVAWITDPGGNVLGIEQPKHD